MVLAAGADGEEVKLRYVVGIDDPHNISQFDLGADLAFVDTQPFLCKNA
jgi:hypothetical protein